VVPDPPELLVHDVEVVEDPLRGGGDLLLRQDRPGDVPVRGQQDLGVLANPREEVPASAALVDDAMRRGQALGVLLQALDAEELRPDRFLQRGGGVDDGGRGVQWEPPSRDVRRGCFRRVSKAGVVSSRLLWSADGNSTGRRRCSP